MSTYTKMKGGFVGGGLLSYTLLSKQYHSTVDTSRCIDVDLLLPR